MRPLLLLSLLSACFVERSHYDTQIMFEETVNIGSSCRGPLTEWTVTNLSTDESGTASCDQPVLFTGLSGNRRYTFDIRGYSGNRLCWTGTCDVTAEWDRRINADCSRAIKSGCL